MKQYNITVVPLTVSINNEEFLETVDIMPEEFFQKMFASEELPKTSQPSPAVFAEAFSGLVRMMRFFASPFHLV